MWASELQQTRLTLILSGQIRFLKTSCNWAEENEK
jgi:hypothetical protein